MAKGPVKILFEDLDAQSAGGTAITLTSGGRFLLMVEAGTWASAVFILQVETPNGTFVPIGSTITTVDGVQVMQLPAGQYRGVVTTDIPTDLYAYLVPIAHGD